MNSIKHIFFAFLAILFFNACGDNNESNGIVSLSITDTPPKLGADVTEVNIAISGIEYNHDGNWVTANDFVPKTLNLLEFQNGKSLLLGDLIFPPGHYTEIRFKLAAPTKESEVKSNPGCNITFADGSSEPLFIPSGGQSGYKGKGDFDVISNAKISITADFDVQKSIVVTGNRKYLLKPVIRLIATELSGIINGTILDISNFQNSNSLVAYAFESGTYQTGDTIGDDGILFTNSISSSDVNMSNGNFILSFLGEGNYSIITSQYIGEELDSVVDVENDVEVLIGNTTFVDINTSD